MLFARDIVVFGPGKPIGRKSIKTRRTERGHMIRKLKTEMQQYIWRIFAEIALVGAV